MDEEKEKDNDDEDDQQLMSLTRLAFISFDR